MQDFFLKYLGATAAVVLIIGPFFGDHLRPVDNVVGRAHMLSTMRYHTSVVIYLFGALGTLASSSRKLMRLTAYADRIADMQRTVQGLASSEGGLLLSPCFASVSACCLSVSLSASVCLCLSVFVYVSASLCMAACVMTYLQASASIVLSSGSLQAVIQTGLASSTRGMPMCS